MSTNKTVPSPSKSALLLRDTYQIYAKMLALENIRVVFDEAIKAPAQFDLLNRILYISPVHSAQAHLIPGLVIHEVGHALYSNLTQAEAKKLKRITKLLNIIDDGYQERMMCKKYANAKKHLFTIFDEFFLKTDGSAYVNPNKLISIVNILNFNCKGFKHGHYKQYPNYVLPEDVKLLREAESIALPTLMQRNDFAKKLAKALKKYGEMDLDEGEDFNKGEGEDGEKKKGEKGEEEDDQPLMDDEDAEDEGDDSEEEADAEKDVAEDSVENELEANESDLNDHHKKIKHQMGGPTSYELPTFRNLLDLSQVLDIVDKDNGNYKHFAFALDDIKNRDVVDQWRKTQKEAKKIANQIFTKFNMRVQAQNMANTQYKQSGMLDPERAALYQVYDDVFMKQAIDPNQQNHGYAVVLDWSGSMMSSAEALMYRILELTYFAKSAGVELEVWLYTSGGSSKSPDVNLDRNTIMMGSKFIHILNTKRNSTLDLERRLMFFYILASNGKTKVRGIPEVQKYLDCYQMAGTNVLEGLILGHRALSMMQADKKACFVLSDGDDSDGFNITFTASGKAGSIGAPRGKVIVNGMDVDKMYDDSRSTRKAATRAFAELCLAAGQKTTGVAWNSSPSTLTPFCQNVIAMETSRNRKTEKDAYIYADNQFIDEVVKNLL